MSMNSKKSVDRSICSVVFQSILSFFTNLMGKVIYMFVNINFENLHGWKECFSEIEQKIIQKDNPLWETLQKVIQVFSRFYFLSSKNVWQHASSYWDQNIRRHQHGNYFLRQMMASNNEKEVNVTMKDLIEMCQRILYKQLVQGTQQGNLQQK